MRHLSRCAIALTLLALVALSAAAQNNAAPHTAITIPEMECQDCAKKVADKIYTVPGVGTVQANYQTHVLIVTPRPQSAMSPRQLWEAVEAAGKKPTKLECPAGTFTAKPQS
jgi:copper chaperone CopZ